MGQNNNLGSQLLGLVLALLHPERLKPVAVHSSGQGLALSGALFKSLYYCI